MIRRSLISAPRFFTTLTAVAVAAIVAGCSNGSGGGTGGGAGGGGAGGGGGAESAEPETCTSAGASRACEGPGDAPGAPTGSQQCAADAHGALTWSNCTPSSTSSTPLVLSFDGAPVTLAATLGAFDVNGTMSVVTDWPAAATPWLALDRDGNGAIDDGSELFGSATVLRSGQRASNGFVALAELDSNGDGRITPEDAAWASLRLWGDADGDRVSSAGEVSGLGARRVLWIDLGYRSERRCDARRNCEIERAAFGWADEAGGEHVGAIVDVHLRHQ